MGQTAHHRAVQLKMLLCDVDMRNILVLNNIFMLLSKIVTLVCDSKITAEHDLI